MKIIGLVSLILAAGMCSAPELMTAMVQAQGSQTAKVGEAVDLVVKVTNTGPVIPHLGLVFRTADKWFERHHVTDLGGCVVAAEESAFDCGDLAKSETRMFAFHGVATQPGTFHYELALRELVQPFDYVNDHPDGADVQIWDEVVTPT
ncbi:MAG TPA: hypothetical protein VJQ08_06625 [Candidatus Dormibacteraeota bacterium]|nr:hypothetical protein [Candidatus Dormibacteraeota bacterium]